MTVKIYVSFKSTVPDPSANALLATARDVGLTAVNTISTGKYFEVEINESDRRKARSIAIKISKLLLANQVFEDFRVELPKPTGRKKAATC